MFIKQILAYDWNYAEYIVSDGNSDLICMCESVPLPNGKNPKVGMYVSMLFAFSINKLEIRKMKDDNNALYKISKGANYFNYFLQGKIIDKTNSLIRIYDFIISLEKDYPHGFPVNFHNEEIIEFNVDRIDCTIESIL